MKRNQAMMAKTDSAHPIRKASMAESRILSSYLLCCQLWHVERGGSEWRDAQMWWLLWDWVRLVSVRHGEGRWEHLLVVPREGGQTVERTG